MIPTSWSEIKPLVQALNPEFYTLIEEVQPDPNLKITILDYHYGQQICDDRNFYFPDGTPLPRSAECPLPQMMLLEGFIELYFETNTSAVPTDTFIPGCIFPSVLHAELSVEKRFSSNLNFKLLAGARSAYMLQLHAYNEYYAHLKKHYRIPSEFNASNPLHHYKILSHIAQKENSPWRVRILLFDNKWVEHIWQDPKWLNLRLFFYKKALKASSPWTWSITFNQALRDITRTHNFKLKDYSEDIIRQILFNATGTFSAFIPAHDESALPLHTLARAFNEFYSTHNLPVIMHTWQSDALDETKYLSIAQNTVTTYDIKTYRPLVYLTEVKEYLPQYLEHLQTHLMMHDTIYGQMYGRLQVDYYSEKGVEEEGIFPARQLQHDLRIVSTYAQYRMHDEQTFPERAPFLKAFVGFTFR